MWKFLSLGLRETLKKRACRSDIYSQTSTNGDNSVSGEVKKNLARESKPLLPCALKCFNNFCGSAKSSGTGSKQEHSDYNPKYTWTDAVGWSSALAIGWVICQSLCFRRRYFERESKETFYRGILPVAKAHIPNVLTHVFHLPKYVLPIANCISDNKSNLVGKKDSYNANTVFGPITSEKAFEEATNEFANIHNNIMGEFELKFGIKALEEERYKDAFEHFSIGATLSSAGSTFNLGLCHELGLGTLIDLVKAAKYYRDAAELGHADAMYNLGVFHARGKGGLPINNDAARKYFVKAAKLGQAQAQYALHLENTNSQSREDYDFGGSDTSEYSAKIMPDEIRRDLSFKALEHANMIQERLEYIGNTNSYTHCGQKLRDRYSIKDLYRVLGLNKTNAITVE